MTSTARSYLIFLNEIAWDILSSEIMGPLKTSIVINLLSAEGRKLKKDPEWDDIIRQIHDGSKYGVLTKLGWRRPEDVIHKAQLWPRHQSELQSIQKQEEV